MSEELNKSEGNSLSNESRWYVVHTYSGYEKKVKANIEKIIENRGMQEQIHKVIVPVQDCIEVKNGQKKNVQRKVFPGYVLLKMFMNDDTWYVVRNTRGVTSFVGPGSKPVPLSDEEVRAMGIGDTVEKLDIEINDTIRVSDGSFAEYEGQIREINLSKKKATVMLSIFGRETPVKIDFDKIEKI